ncbi:GAF and ANTAR domain-containing protein [Ornithinimicrobium sufpigmenti]|uniref:GAF and ANTAR domain-containing protein n=1 Tax=Ornithinimicrobium sufpigmenti TaxID=2508882 RepID=UPI001035C877|nr:MULTISPECIES: GAF and ANTAR domain-containing protein [unclassified Ornithinimicrobium]
MVDRGDVLAQLALKIARTPTEEPLASRVCRACQELLHADGVALTIGYSTDSRVTVCSTDDVAARLEDLQEVLGEGPGPEAAATGHLARGLLPADRPDRWPMLSEAVRSQLHTVHVLALPLAVGTDPIGVLTLHRQAPFSVQEEEIAQFLADAIGAAILRDSDGRSDAPSEPWLTRSRVHMATGMVVAQLGVAPEDALALIRAYAFAHDQTLNRVAEEIVERRVRLDVSPPGGSTP